MKRRDFVKQVSLGSLVAGFSINSFLNSCSATIKGDDEFRQMVSNLLKEWCDGMIRQQVIHPGRPELHGSLDCPSCEHIHGRCMDAVYPFLYMADTTGEEKYLSAAKLVMEWAENNVSHADGSWTVIPNPKSWKGITVFGAIALAEALHYHGHILDEGLKEIWTNRVDAAMEYVYKKFDLTFTNINYGATAIYALNLVGKLLNKQKFIDRSRELASGISVFFTQPNHFLWGEGKPSDKKSAKGLPAIDLGYNVEESLSNLVLYAVEENDEELIALLRKSLDTHLEFMLPDGAWDNSWGTRQFKWSYWGSRTCDGSQLTYASMMKYNPAYYSAVVRNTELLNKCTGNGLLHGGPGYLSNGIKPCIHHTFEHAKPLASLLNNWDKLHWQENVEPLPREKEYGVKYFSEIDTALLARGSWRGTVTAYDAIYYKGEYRQATGGSLSVLYHQKVGLLMAASMAKYKMVEKNNQQPNPGADFALTPRIETFIKEEWYSNLYDLTAQIEPIEGNNIAKCKAKVQLKNEALKVATGTASVFEMDYQFKKDRLVISAKTGQTIKQKTALVLPIIADVDEKVVQLSSNEIEIHKKKGVVSIKANVPLLIENNPETKVFNMVPGTGAIPIMANFTEQCNSEIQCEIQVG